MITMNSKKAVFISLLLSFGVFLIFGCTTGFFEEFFINFPGLKTAIKKAIQENREILTPGPLRAVSDSQKAFLTRQGVVEWTNRQREQNGLPPLTEDLKLNASATMKVQDMLARQYFEHVSPTGADVSDLATNAGYKFLSIGENLALGNFKDDRALVQAWMDSPGHRANILNAKFRDIGVAVIKGKFEGRTTWLAVQHFGLSEDVCPAPSKILKSTIDSRSIQLEQMRQQLDAMQRDINDTQPKRGEEYNRKVDEYNTSVKQYNSLLDEQKAWISQYNSQVNSFNSCLQHYQ